MRFCRFRLEKIGLEKIWKILPESGKDAFLVELVLGAGHAQTLTIVPNSIGLLRVGA